MSKKSKSALVPLSSGPDPVCLDAGVLASSRGLIQGSSGSGKSFLARLIAEGVSDMMPMFIIDPEGEYYTMREKCSMVLVGPGGEIRADPSTAGKVARGLLKESCSAIIDLSDLPSREHNRYVGSFIDAMMHAPRSCWRPTLVFIDEAHRFCPEGGSKSTSESSDAIKDLMSRGRKRGFGGVLLTQRISKVSKDAVGEAANQFFGITYQDLDIKRTADTLGMSPKDALVLRNLERGEWFAHGPALSHKGVDRFQALRPMTDSPDTTGDAQPPVKNARVVKQLAVSVADSIASSDDPLTLEEAQDAIASLRKELKSALKKSPSKPGPDSAAVARLEAMLRESKKCESDAIELRDKMVFEARRIVESVISDSDDFISGIARQINARPALAEKALASLSALSAVSARSPGASMPKIPSASPVPPESPPAVDPVADPSFTGSADDRFMAALAWWSIGGVSDPNAAQIGLVAGISAKSSTFRSARASLRQQGLIEYSGKSTILTAAGRASVAGMVIEPSLAQWHEMIRKQLGSGAALRVFDYLITVTSSDLEDLGAACDLSPTSSTVRSALGLLRNLGLVEKGQPIRGSRLMCPESLS